MTALRTIVKALENYAPTFLL